MYVWLVDSQAVARFDPENEQEAYEPYVDPLCPPCYRGWVKIGCGNIPDAWFERLARMADDEYVFACEEWEGDWRYVEGYLVISVGGRDLRGSREVRDQAVWCWFVVSAVRALWLVLRRGKIQDLRRAFFTLSGYGRSPSKLTATFKRFEDVIDELALDKHLFMPGNVGNVESV